jgi:hypothetical protein
MPSCSSGLGFFPLSSFCLVVSTAFSCKNIFRVLSSVRMSVDTQILCYSVEFRLFLYTYLRIRVLLAIYGLGLKP